MMVCIDRPNICYRNLVRGGGIFSYSTMYGYNFWKSSFELWNQLLFYALV